MRLRSKRPSVGQQEEDGDERANSRKQLRSSRQFVEEFAEHCLPRRKRRRAQQPQRTEVDAERVVHQEINASSSSSSLPDTGIGDGGDGHSATHSNVMKVEDDGFVTNPTPGMLKNQDPGQSASTAQQISDDSIVNQKRINADLGQSASSSFSSTSSSSSSSSSSPPPSSTTASHQNSDKPATNETRVIERNADPSQSSTSVQISDSSLVSQKRINADFSKSTTTTTSQQNSNNSIDNAKRVAEESADPNQSYHLNDDEHATPPGSASNQQAVTTHEPGGRSKQSTSTLPSNADRSENAIITAKSETCPLCHDTSKHVHVMNFDPESGFNSCVVSSVTEAEAILSQFTRSLTVDSRHKNESVNVAQGGAEWSQLSPSMGNRVEDFEMDASGKVQRPPEPSTSQTEISQSSPPSSKLNHLSTKNHAKESEVVASSETRPQPIIASSAQVSQSSNREKPTANRGKATRKVSIRAMAQNSTGTVLKSSHSELPATQIGSYFCAYCSLKFDRQDQINWHIKHLHPIQHKSLLKCPKDIVSNRNASGNTCTSSTSQATAADGVGDDDDDEICIVYEKRPSTTGSVKDGNRAMKSLNTPTRTKVAMQTSTASSASSSSVKVKKNQTTPTDTGTQVTHDNEAIRPSTSSTGEAIKNQTTPIVEVSTRSQPSSSSSSSSTTTSRGLANQTTPGTIVAAPSYVTNGTVALQPLLSTSPVVIAPTTSTFAFTNLYLLNSEYAAAKPQAPLSTTTTTTITTGNNNLVPSAQASERRTTRRFTGTGLGNSNANVASPLSSSATRLIKEANNNNQAIQKPSTSILPATESSTTRKSSSLRVASNNDNIAGEAASSLAKNGVFRLSLTKIFKKIQPTTTTTKATLNDSKRADSASHVVKGKAERRNEPSSSAVGPAAQLLKCEQCDLFFDQASFEGHRASMHGDQYPFHCAYCPSSFSTRNHWMRHEYNQHASGRGFTCDQCNVNFMDKVKYTAHWQKQHGETERSNKNRASQSRITKASLPLPVEACAMRNADHGRNEANRQAVGLMQNSADEQPPSTCITRSNGGDKQEEGSGDEIMIVGEVVKTSNGFSYRKSGTV